MQPDVMQGGWVSDMLLEAGVVFYHRSMGERCGSIRHRLQTRRDGLVEAYATGDAMAHLREISSRMVPCRGCWPARPLGAEIQVLHVPAASEMMPSPARPAPARAASTSRQNWKRAVSVNSEGTPVASKAFAVPQQCAASARRA
jgi:hypothetical protein